MTTIDIDRLSPEERLSLIERLWDSLDDRDVALTAAQATEIDRRLANLDEDIKHARGAETIIEELERRFR
jgi:putative addiction module component (TIGR02574 family)